MNAPQPLPPPPDETPRDALGRMADEVTYLQTLTRLAHAHRWPKEQRDAVHDAYQHARDRFLFAARRPARPDRLRGGRPAGRPRLGDRLVPVDPGPRRPGAAAPRRDADVPRPDGVSAAAGGVGNGAAVVGKLAVRAAMKTARWLDRTFGG